jgi:hypothetical protein
MMGHSLEPLKLTIMDDDIIVESKLKDWTAKVA